MSAHATSAIAIIGVGARTAVGRSLPASAAAVRARLANITSHPYLVDRFDRKHKVGRAEWLPDRFDGAARCLVLARNAAKEALAPLAHGDRRPARVGAFVGLPEPRPGRPADLESEIAGGLRATLADRSLTAGGSASRVEMLAEGHAAGLVAVQRAAEAIREDSLDLCLAGGVDSYLEGDTMDWLEANGRLLGVRNRWGFIPGEAAGFCLLASSRWARKARIAAPLHWMDGTCAREEITLASKGVCLGRGLSTAFDGALGSLRGAGRSVQALIGDLNGEPYRSDELGFAVSRSADAIALRGRIVAPAEQWGDVGASSGPLFVGLAFAEASRPRSVKGETLLWASSEGGCRAAAVVSARPLEDQEER